MSASPDSARPATRRALRERSRARSGADGDPGADAETPTDAASEAPAAVLTPADEASAASPAPEPVAPGPVVPETVAPETVVPELGDADAAALGLDTADDADAELRRLVAAEAKTAPGGLRGTADDEASPTDADADAADGERAAADAYAEPDVSAETDAAVIAVAEPDAAADTGGVDAGRAVEHEIPEHRASEDGAPSPGASDEPLPATSFLQEETTAPVAASARVADPDPETDFLADLEPAPARRATPETHPAAEPTPAVAPESSPASEPAAEPEPLPTRVPAQWADERRPPSALTWIDTDAIAAASALPSTDGAAPRDIFAGARLTPGWRRPRVLVPIGIVGALCGAYVATTLLWPLHAVAPQVAAVKVDIAPAPAAAMSWPQTGSAAVGVQGLSTVASATTTDEIASISKVASVLMVLDEMPLKVGEQGPSFEFDYGDAREYWQYRRANQSALDVPVGGSLTEYQMLQGVMLGSANNYIDRLADELWGRHGFPDAARAWLSDHGITGITLESASGFDERNVATPAALVALGELAMKNPVFAEIAATKSVEIPGAGTVTNTNEMLSDPGVIGIKTGTLSGWNLLTAKEVPVGDTTVRVFTSVLGQEDNDARLAVTRSLLAEVEKALADQPVTVPAGTVVGTVSTEWGAEADVVTDADAQVVLWNGAAATASTVFDLGEQTAKGAEIGTLTAQGPLDSDETTVSLAKEIPGPSIWWRLTHPLELFGLDKG